MMTVRFISRVTGRQIKSANIDETFVRGKRSALKEVCDSYINGLYMFNNTLYSGGEIEATRNTINDLTEREKVMLLKQNGVYRSAAERAVKDDMVIFYPDTNDGMKDYFNNRVDFCSPKDKKHGWNRLDKVDYFDEYGNFLCAYRYDYYV